MKPSELENGESIVYNHSSGRTFTFFKEGEDLIVGTINIPELGDFEKEWTAEQADVIDGVLEADASWSLEE